MDESNANRAYQAVLFDLYGTLVNDRAEAIDGALRVLGALPAERWAVVTSCPRRLALAMLQHAGLPLPDTLVSADDVQRGKPAPDCYLLAAERLGAAAANCLVVEDSAGGVIAAAAAGMDVINVNEAALSDLVFGLVDSGVLLLRR